MLHNLKQYRQAKVFVSDLKGIIAILTEYQSKLMMYKKYNPVLRIINNITENKKVLKFYLDKQQAILDSKGEEKDE